MEKLRKWFRHPKTTQERRAYFTSPKLVRAKRRPANLVDAWDELWITKQKSWKWKSKKRKQWESKKRKQWEK